MAIPRCLHVDITPSYYSQGIIRNLVDHKSLWIQQMSIEGAIYQQNSMEINQCVYLENHKWSQILSIHEDQILSKFMNIPNFVKVHEDSRIFCQSLWIL
jgi:hypothetical protein